MPVLHTLSLQHVLIAALIGAIAGAHAAIWGMYKDAIHEGFTAARFARSIVVGGVLAVLIYVARPLDPAQASGAVVLFGLAYAAERGVIEVWKTFVRNEDQSKYFIPMQFSVGGVPVRSRLARLAAGVGYVAVVGLCLYAISRLDVTPPTLPRWVVAAGVGLAIGGIAAIGGAWKDAPKEGFEILKFFRSPLLAVTFSLVLSRMTDSYLEVAAAAIGYERATAETYKTFFFPSRPRGKFTGKPVLYPEMIARRRYFVPVYVAIWVMVLASGAVALRDVAVRPRLDGPARPATEPLSIKNPRA